ncbi:MAG: hypothetical protein V1660_03220 [archaeon]
MKHWNNLSKRIDLKKLSLLERFMLRHADPIQFTFHIIAAIVLMYGLWINNLNYIFVALFFALMGHLYSSIKK